MTLERAASAGLWSTVETVSRQGLSFLITLVLARLLTPAEFGIVAIVVFFSSLASVVLHGGFSAALVQRSASTPAEESSVFWWGLIASSLLALAMGLAGSPLAAFFGYPIIAPLMLVAGVQQVFTSLGLVQGAIFVRQLRFKILAKISLASTLISGLLAIAAAAWGAGAWALGIQMGSSAALGAAFTWMASSWRPIPHFRPSTMKPLFNFGSFVSLSGFLEVLYAQGVGLVIAKLYGPRDLGLFNRALSAQNLPNSILVTIVSRVALPLFSERADDREALRRGFRRASSLAMFLNVPAMAGLAVLSDLILYVLYGAAWVPAAPILSILAISGLLLPIHAINLQLLLARGGAASFFGIEIAKKIVGLTCLLIGSLYGILGLAIGHVVSSVIALFLNTHLTRKSIGYGVMAQLVDLSGIWFCTGVMVILLLLTRSAIGLPPVPSLLLLMSLGVVSYISLGALLRFRSFREAFEIGEILLKTPRSSADAAL